MILTLTRDEAALVRYALDELANRRAEQEVEAGINQASFAKDVAEANRNEARRLRGLAERVSNAMREEEGR